MIGNWLIELSRIWYVSSIWWTHSTLCFCSLQKQTPKKFQMGEGEAPYAHAGTDSMHVSHRWNPKTDRNPTGSDDRSAFVLQSKYLNCCFTVIFNQQKFSCRCRSCTSTYIIKYMYSLAHTIYWYNRMVVCTIAVRWYFLSKQAVANTCKMTYYRA